MKQKKIKLINIEIFLGVMCACLFFVGTEGARADYWGAASLATIQLRVMDEMDEQLDGIILGKLKQTAVEMLSSQVDGLLSGSSMGGSLIIQDWDDYLFEASKDNTKAYANDFLSASVSGKNSTTNYISNSGDFNYARYLTEYAKSQTVGSGRGSSKNSLIEEMIGNPSVPKVDTAGWRQWNAIRESNPIGNTLMAQSAIMEKQRQEEKKAEIKAIVGGGYKDIENRGKTITPASSIKALKEQSQAMAFNIISSANNPPEVITSVLSKFIIKTFQGGVGMAQQAVMTESRNAPQTPKPWENPNKY